MRKISNMFMLVAAAAMTFVSCQKEENRAPETVSATLTMHAGVDQTKTYLDENNAVLWGKGEAVRLYVGTGEGEDAIATFVASTSTDAYDGAETASFTFDITGVAENGPYNLGGIYPASASMEDNKDPKKCKTILPQIQNAEVGKYDPSAYIMVLKPETVETLPNEYLASFRRATALNKITLTNVKEDITTVEITVPEGQALAGRRYFDLTDGTSGEIYYGQSNTITVNAPFTGSTIDVWFCSWGAELAAGEEMTIRMKNANKAYTRTIVAKEAGIKFVEGNLNKLTVDMASAEEESFDSFAGEWLITATSSNVTYAAGAYVTGKNNLSNNVAITISNDVIEPVDGIENCKMLFTKVTEGDYEGMYTIQDANGNYLYAAASGSNHLKATETADSEHYYWTVESKDGKHSIVASKSSNRNVMQFNPNNGNPIFSCYASATQTALVLYPFSMVKVDTTPKIAVSETTKDVAFGGETVTFGYELKYLDGEELTWEVSDSEIITEVTAEDGVLSVTVAENAGDARTATVTLSCGDAENVTLTIDQAKYVDLSVIQKITVAEFATLNDGDAIYELSGTITGIYQAYNASYDNISFYLNDGTGEITIYRMSCEGVDYNKVVEGNVITVQGAKGSYSGAAQMAAGCICVSLVEASKTPSISFENNTVSITAAAGATIYYTTTGEDPTTESSVYTASFEITEDTTVKAIAVEDGKLASSVAVANCAWKDPNAAGDDAIVAPSGTILWAETWADAGSTSTSFASNTAISAYTYAGRTGFEDNATDVTYTADASNNVRITKSSGGNCTSGHLWFNKSVAGELKTSAIKLYGATSVSFSHSQGTSGSSCQTSYSFDGGSTWTTAGTQSGAIAKKTYTITVPIGTESIMIKLTHDSSNSKNTRVDNLELKVN